MSAAPRAVVVVRNAATHDARVLRCARTLRSMGYEALVLAVASEQEGARRAVVQEIPIVRLKPAAPLAGLAGSLQRRWKGFTGQGRQNPSSEDAGRPALGPRRLSPPARAYRLLRTLSYYRQGIAALRALRPRLVHCNDYNTMWIGVGAKLLSGCTLVYDSHELWPDRNGRSEPRWWLLACEALFLRLADANLATSPGHAATIARRHRVPPPLVVRNVPERDGSGPSEAASEATTLAYAGAVTSGRGLEEAIDALPGAPGVALRIVGPGDESYRAALAALAAERGVGERLRIEAAVPPRRVVAELRSAAAGLALIQPCCLSYSLSLPNKLFEYVAAGLPVLAADLPTIREFVEEHEVGLIVPPDDPEAIAAAMTEIVVPDRNRRLRAAVAEAAASLSWEREAARLEAAYREAA